MQEVDEINWPDCNFGIVFRHLPKKNMRSILLLLLCMLGTLLTRAQTGRTPYQTAIGVKIYPGSISVKHFFAPNKAGEGLLYFWNYGMRATSLYEIHGDFQEVDGLRWYIGPGAHIGFWNSTWRAIYPARQSGIALGVDGVIGLDYTIKNAPINVSLDWQPSFNIIGYSYFEGAWGGIGIRYILP